MKATAAAASAASLLYIGPVKSIAEALATYQPDRMTLVDASSPATRGSANLATLDGAKDKLWMDLDWTEVLRVSEETSFRFLANDPELFRPEDVEPV